MSGFELSHSPQVLERRAPIARAMLASLIISTCGNNTADAAITPASTIVKSSSPGFETLTAKQAHKIALSDNAVEAQIFADAIASNDAAYLDDIKTRSGVEFLFYQAGTGDQREIKVDRKKLNKMMNFVFSEINDLSSDQTAYPKSDLIDLAKKGRAGKLNNFKITAIISDDPKQTLSQGNSHTFEHSTEEKEVSAGRSYDIRDGLFGYRKEETSMVLAGMLDYTNAIPPKTYSSYLRAANSLINQAKDDDEIHIYTDPNELSGGTTFKDEELRLNSVFVHEVMHSMLGSINRNQKVDKFDKEHLQIVYPMQQSFNFKCGVLGNSGIEPLDIV